MLPSALALVLAEIPLMPKESRVTISKQRGLMLGSIYWFTERELDSSDRSLPHAFLLPLLQNLPLSVAQL